MRALPIAVGPVPIPINITTIPIIITSDPAYTLAVKRHIEALSPEERQAFDTGAQITPQALVARIQDFDRMHSQNSRLRACANRVDKFLTILDQYLKPLAICIGHSPGISSLVVGGVKLIIDVCGNGFSVWKPSLIIFFHALS